MPYILPKLTSSPETVRAKLAEQIVRGTTLAAKVGSNSTNLFWTEANHSELWRKKDKWSEYVFHLLKVSFLDSGFADEFMRVFGSNTPTSQAPEKRSDAIAEDVVDACAKLELVVELLDLMEQQTNQDSVSPPAEVMQRKGPGKDVFIVHGSDEAAKESVARYVEKLGLNAIILHEQPNRGRAIIEKLEQSAEVAFAVVLLTPDDIGRKKGESGEDRPRARQNVILELGFFMAKLGRANVCALFKEGVEIPSDYSGVLYVAMDDHDGWRPKLAKELQEAHLSVNLQKVI